METTRHPESRSAARQSGIRLEIITIVWMTLEGAMAIGAGVIAGSGLLIAFGLDSVIELLSGIVLLWRLRAEAENGNIGGSKKRSAARRWSPPFCSPCSAFTSP